MATLSFVAVLTFFIIKIVYGNDDLESLNDAIICKYGSRCVTDPRLVGILLAPRCRELGPREWCGGELLSYNGIKPCFGEWNEEGSTPQYIECYCKRSPGAVVTIGCEFMAETIQEEFYSRPSTYDITDPKVKEYVCKNDAVDGQISFSNADLLEVSTKKPCIFRQPYGPVAYIAHLGYRYMCCRPFNDSDCDFKK